MSTESEVLSNHLILCHPLLLLPSIFPSSCCCQVASVVSDSVQPHRQQPTRLPRPWDSPGKNTGVGCHFLLQCMKGKVKVKSLNHVWLLVTPWTTAYQAPPSMGFSRQEYWNEVSLPSLIFPSIRVISSESALCIRQPKYWHFSLSIILPMNIQDWFPLGLTGLISLVHYIK